MKRTCGKVLLTLLSVFISILLSSCIIGLDGEVGEEVVTFKDKAVEKEVREIIGKTEGEIYLDDVIHIVGINLREKGISDLGGIEHLESLKYLYAGNNLIVDISPLSGLNKLKSLELPNNDIDDISPISSLVNLKSLDLSSNVIEDITPLSELKELKDLYLDNNKIRDIDPLEKLVRLRRLLIDHNRVKDISLIEELIRLHFLKINNNEIKDISPLKGLIKLNELNVSYNGMTIDFVEPDENAEVIQEHVNNCCGITYSAGNTVITTYDVRVTFKDDNLEKVIREKINKPTNRLYLCR